MPIAPVIQYVLLCEDWNFDGPNNRRLTIHGLIWNIRSLEDPPFPLLHQGFCVFLAMAGGRGDGEGQIVCVLKQTRERIFETRKRAIPFPTDPLEVVGVPFRIGDCIFPHAGRYSVQFWYDGVMIEERPLNLR